jgi:hypothetical protein
MMITQSTQEVEEFGTERACREIANIACTRCTESINTPYREEIGRGLMLEVVVSVVGKGDLGVKKEESAVAKYHRRGTVQRMKTTHRE